MILNDGSLPRHKSMKSQWDCIRENLGTWNGSFTQFSLEGEEIKDTPSILTLAEQPDESIKLVLTRTPPDGEANEMVRGFSKPGPGPMVPFLDTGAFSQGSNFWSSYSRNGAELALTTPERRLRLVLLYAGLGGSSRLSEITLIRETRAGSNAVESAPLTVDQLLGTWEGESLSLFPDGRVVEGIKSNLVMQQSGDRLEQSLTFGDASSSSPSQRTITSTARIDGNRLLFEEGPFPIQVLMLPGGASANAPLDLPSGHAFFLEAGWMTAPGHRQRLMRRYDDKGNWESVTLVQERKVS